MEVVITQPESCRESSQWDPDVLSHIATSLSWTQRHCAKPCGDDLSHQWTSAPFLSTRVPSWKVMRFLFDPNFINYSKKETNTKWKKESCFFPRPVLLPRGALITSYCLFPRLYIGRFKEIHNQDTFKGRSDIFFRSWKVRFSCWKTFASAKDKRKKKLPPLPLTQNCWFQAPTFVVNQFAIGFIDLIWW